MGVYRISKEQKQKKSKNEVRKLIEYLVMDVDGTLTDGKIYMGENGELMKQFHIKDGLGIHELLPMYHIEPIIITGRSSTIVENRCRELGIKQLHQGISNKMEKLAEILGKGNVNDDDFQKLERVAYIGDDLNDLGCMKTVKQYGGVIGCPLDAVKEVIKISDFVSRFKGGDGAVREFIEYLVEKRGAE